MRPSPLPVELGPGPFTTAEARRLGVPGQRQRPRAPGSRRARPGRAGDPGGAVDSPAGTTVRVVDVADTWCDLGELPRGSLSTTDLVVVGDAVVALLDARAGRAVGVRALHEALAARNRPRGAVSLRHALTLVRPGVRSPMETRARLMFVDAGFPEPEVNAPLTDAAGEWLAEGDLVWRRQRVVGEYQGEQHADRRRRSADAFRQGLVESHDWQIKALWAEDLHRGPRRRWTLMSFAKALDLDPATLRIA